MSDKTLAVSLSELQSGIINLINTSNVPMYLTRYVLKEIYQEVNQLANTQIEDEINQWKASQVQTLEEGDSDEHDREVD